MYCVMWNGGCWRGCAASSSLQVPWARGALNLVWAKWIQGEAGTYRGDPYLTLAAANGMEDALLLMWISAVVCNRVQSVSTLASLRMLQMPSLQKRLLPVQL